jgi:tetratricopeptide (TPR) repeat protein
MFRSEYQNQKGIATAALSACRFLVPFGTSCRQAALSIIRLTRFSAYATGPNPPSNADNGLAHAQQLLEDGTRALEEGDLQRAKALYEQSVAASATSGGYFNLGVCEYQLTNLEGAIAAWKRSIQVEPSDDAYTSEFGELWAEGIRSKVNGV